MNYRNRKLLDIAHEAPCLLEIRNVCDAGFSLGGRASNPCHSNLQRHGRGFAYKSHDCFVVPGCNPCHQWLDSGKATREEKDEAFMKALERYWLWLWTEGKIKCA